MAETFRQAGHCEISLRFRLPEYLKAQQLNQKIYDLLLDSQELNWYTFADLLAIWNAVWYTRCIQ
jgi:hypothetical protein